MVFSLKKLNAELKSAHDFDARKLFEAVSGSSGVVDFENLSKFLSENKSKMRNEEIGCIFKQLDGSGQGEISLDDFKTYVATLKISHQHQLFDDMRTGPAIRTKHLQETRDRELALYERFLENELYRDLNILRHDSEKELFSYQVNTELHKSIKSKKKPFQRASSAKKP